jgi:hypothetical protein
MAFSYFKFVVPGIKYNYSFSTFNVGITHYKLYSKPIQFHIYVFSTFSPFLPSVNFSLRSFYTFGHILGSVILRSVFLRSVILCSVFFYLQSFYVRSFYVQTFYLPSFYVQTFYLPSFYVQSFYERSRFHINTSTLLKATKRNSLNLKLKLDQRCLRHHRDMFMFQHLRGFELNGKCWV